MTLGEQISNLLGLATRARKTITGEELVVKEIRSQKAKLVVLSNDASKNTAKKLTINVHLLTLSCMSLETGTISDMRREKRPGWQ